MAMAGKGSGIPKGGFKDREQLERFESNLSHFGDSQIAV